MKKEIEIPPKLESKNVKVRIITQMYPNGKRTKMSPNMATLYPLSVSSH